MSSTSASSNATGDPRDWGVQIKIGPSGYEPIMPSGWICPKCHGINSPYVTQCPACSPAPQRNFKKPWFGWPEAYIGDPLPGQETTITCGSTL